MFAWLKVMLASFLREKNTAGWLADLADNLKRTGCKAVKLAMSSFEHAYILLL
jgi:hypothetical protein